MLLAALLLCSPASAAFSESPRAFSENSRATAELLAEQDPVLPPGFQETVAFSGLVQPTAIRFAPDGRVFVAEKGGRIQVFEDLDDPTPSLYADLSEDVHDYWDRGLLGLALDPGFSTGRPYVYVLYAYNKDPNSAEVPRWPDACPDPPGGSEDGCTITGRLSRLGGGFEQVLIEDWCQQYPSHSIGSLAFGADGALYVSGGDGASFDFADWGQFGIPRNPCGDPPQPVGGAQALPNAEGGALRSQDIRTPADPTGLGGAILRVSPDTGAALPDNPNASSPDPNARRIVAYGLRNPFRITVRPGTSEVWAGDVGWQRFEEINRVPNPTTEVRNFGWPCYEGMGRTAGYQDLGVQLCESLSDAAHTQPHFAYDHLARVVPMEACPFGGSSISGVAFTPPESSFPPAYDGALFFSDFTRSCIWAMKRGAGGLPDPGNVETFVSDAHGPVELQFGPGGDLYYVDLLGGTIRRIRSTTGNHAPVARATATPASGPTPLTVHFDGSASSDLDGPLAYEWDLDGDGAFDDGTGVTAQHTYATPGNHLARLRVRDASGLTDVYSLPITAGTPPQVSMSVSAPPGGWTVDDRISFSGTATSGDGTTPTLSWQVNLRHCDRGTGTCHTHPLQSTTGASGSFDAPDHAYPAYLEVELTARDSHGLATTIKRRLDPKTVQLSFASRPAGVRISLGGETVAAPFTRDVIQGSNNTVGVESPQSIAGAPYVFYSWSDGGPRSHTLVADADTTLKATFERDPRRRMAGADYLGPADNRSVAPPGVGEVYLTRADASGTATQLRLFVHDSSTASGLVIGLYADEGGEPGELLGSGRKELPVPGAWNAVDVHIPGIVAGRSYWIGLLNPGDGTGHLRWRDHADGPNGSPELQSPLGGDLRALPATWVTGIEYDGGPVSAYVFGTPAPGLVVDPGSLTFSGQAGAASPPRQTVAVSNAAGGDLAFTASADAGWLSVTPASGRAPDDVSVAVDTAGLAPGTYRAAVRVDAPALGGPPRVVPVTLTLSSPPRAGDPAPPAAPRSGPVGAWGFDERSGRTALDGSGSGNRGTLSGPVRTRGRFGGGLAFDGRRDWVSVPDSPSLDLTTGMTLEAWVRPARVGGAWRTVLVKERGTRLAYGLYAGPRPSGHVYTSAERALRGRSALRRNRWSHLAMTWDGKVIRAYVDGRRVAGHALAGTAQRSSGPLRIGGNGIWPEWFAGVIDEVRVYDRALTAAEIARDRNARITPGAARPRSAKATAGRPRQTKRTVHRGTRWLR